MGFDALVEAVVDGAQVEVVGFDDAEVAFDAQLRAGLSDADVARLSELLGQLATNAGSPASHAPPWAGLADGAPAD